MLCISAPAKINLYLRIVGRRADGYHEIETLFQRVELADRIEAELTDGSGFDLKCHGLPEGTRLSVEDNLMTRAWRALRTVVARDPAGWPGVRMLLFKRIPLGGGLGGGSSDAAATLKALEALWGAELAPANGGAWRRGWEPMCLSSSNPAVRHWARHRRTARSVSPRGSVLGGVGVARLRGADGGGVPPLRPGQPRAGRPFVFLA
jgi:hypothetical protein